MFFVDVFYLSGNFDHLIFSKIDNMKDIVFNLESDENVGCIKAFNDSGLKIYETDSIDWLV